MIGPRIPWHLYANGETHELRDDEIRRLYGRSIDQFRNTLRSHCHLKGWLYSTRKVYYPGRPREGNEGHGLKFRISKATGVWW